MTITAAPETARRARSCSGVALSEIAFPLGGIGTGTVSLSGRGELRDWEIFNRPAKGRYLPFTFFALWCRPADGQPITRVLERRLLAPFVGDRGLSALGCGRGHPVSQRRLLAAPTRWPNFTSRTISCRWRSGWKPTHRSHRSTIACQGCPWLSSSGGSQTGARNRSRRR